MGYNSKYTGQEIEILLDKIKNLKDADNELSLISTNSVQNRIITQELDKIFNQLSEIDVVRWIDVM